MSFFFFIGKDVFLLKIKGGNSQNLSAIIVNAIADGSWICIMSTLYFLHNEIILNENRISRLNDNGDVSKFSVVDCNLLWKSPFSTQSIMLLTSGFDFCNSNLI